MHRVSPRARNISTTEMYQRMKRVGLIDGFILKCYDGPHAQSREHVTEDVLGALDIWESKQAIRLWEPIKFHKIPCGLFKPLIPLIFTKFVVHGGFHYTKNCSCNYEPLARRSQFHESGTMTWSRMALVLFADNTSCLSVIKTGGLEVREN